MAETEQTRLHPCLRWESHPPVVRCHPILEERRGGREPWAEGRPDEVKLGRKRETRQGPCFQVEWEAAS